VGGSLEGRTHEGNTEKKMSARSLNKGKIGAVLDPLQHPTGNRRTKKKGRLVGIALG